MAKEQASFFSVPVPLLQAGSHNKQRGREERPAVRRNCASLAEGPCPWSPWLINLNPKTSCEKIRKKKHKTRRDPGKMQREEQRRKEAHLHPMKSFFVLIHITPYVLPSES